MSEGDVVERLRLLVPSDSSGAAIKAADTITALRAKVERLETDLATARADALEEAARCAETSMGDNYSWNDACVEVAAAIRALATK